MTMHRALALSMSLLCCGTVDAAVSLSRNGQGQGLLFPYFSTEGGQSTVIAVQNQSPSAKALKVRVLESHAGRDTLSFNLYLPAMATWSATIVGDGTAAPGARMFSSAANCTAPKFPSAGVSLRSFAYTGTTADSGPQTLARTREGQVEVIEMGTLDAALSAAAADAAGPGCTLFTTRWATGGVWTVEGQANAGIAPLSSGLRGEATLLNVAAGTAYSYRALGFNGLAASPRHTVPSTSTPALTDVQPQPIGDIRVNLLDDNGNLVALAYEPGRGADAIGALLASNTATASFHTGGGLAARTDWIVSFPTRRSYVDNAPGGLLPAQTPVGSPFASRDCETLALEMFDARGLLISIPSPPAPEPVPLCGQAQVLRFRASGSPPAAPLLGDASGPLVSADNSGTARLAAGMVGAASRLSRPDKNGVCWRGLPMWVLAVTAFDNNNAQPGRIATYPETRQASTTAQFGPCGALR